MQKNLIIQKVENLIMKNMCQLHMLWKKIIVGDQQRVLIAKNGRFSTILAPGEYRLFVALIAHMEVEKHNTNSPVFQSTWADYLVKEQPQLVA